MKPRRQVCPRPPAELSIKYYQCFHQEEDYTVFIKPVSASCIWTHPLLLSFCYPGCPALAPGSVQVVHHCSRSTFPHLRMWHHCYSCPLSLKLYRNFPSAHEHAIVSLISRKKKKDLSISLQLRSHYTASLYSKSLSKSCLYSGSPHVPSFTHGPFLSGLPPHRITGSALSKAPCHFQQSTTSSYSITSTGHSWPLPPFFTTRKPVLSVIFTPHWSYSCPPWLTPHFLMIQCPSDLQPLPSSVFNHPSRWSHAVLWFYV